MGLLRKLLFPLAILYGFIMAVRNFLYDNGILKSHSFDIPVIAVGNVSVGGTGKSPMVEYLIRLLQDDFSLAMLSRGYGRKSRGFLLADENASADSLGDEPFQIHKKFPGVSVAVDADRVNGIHQLRARKNPQVILLDDAFQHRRVKAGMYILLTAYGDLYSDDFLLPTGNLREGWRGARRADIIVVTKCPPDLPESERDAIRKKLRIKRGQLLCFATIGYADELEGESTVPVESVREESKLLVAGIAKPQPFFDYIGGAEDNTLNFRDHHHFSDSDIHTILSQANDRKIVTTEKDFVRLKGKLPADQLFYLPIETQFIQGQTAFDIAVRAFAKS